VVFFVGKVRDRAAGDYARAAQDGAEQYLSGSANIDRYNRASLSRFRRRQPVLEIH